ncbi:MAG: hypothetical protein JRG89_17800 [Deltaproteobacteria bacterium]|nr:hypothetical protein [Deltaproteobacteria bacterium]
MSIRTNSGHALSNFPFGFCFRQDHVANVIDAAHQLVEGLHAFETLPGGIRCAAAGEQQGHQSRSLARCVAGHKGHEYQRCQERDCEKSLHVVLGFAVIGIAVINIKEACAVP